MQEVVGLTDLAVNDEELSQRIHGAAQGPYTGGALQSRQRRSGQFLGPGKLAKPNQLHRQIVLVYRQVKSVASAPAVIDADFPRFECFASVPEIVVGYRDIHVGAAQQIILAPVTKNGQCLVQRLKRVLVAPLECIYVSDVDVRFGQLAPVSHFAKMLLRGGVVITGNLEFAQIAIGPSQPEVATTNGRVVV